MKIGAENLLTEYGTALAVAEALIQGKLNSYQEQFVSDIVTLVILEAAKFRIQNKTAQCSKCKQLI